MWLVSGIRLRTPMVGSTRLRSGLKPDNKDAFGIMPTQETCNVKLMLHSSALNFKDGPTTASTDATKLLKLSPSSAVVTSCSKEAPTALTPSESARRTGVTARSAKSNMCAVPLSTSTNPQDPSTRAASNCQWTLAYFLCPTGGTKAKQATWAFTQELRSELISLPANFR